MKNIDGKTIYQKTFTGSLNLTTTVGTEVATEITLGFNLDEIIKVEGVLYNGNNVYQPLTASRTDGARVRYSIWNNGGTAPEKNVMKIYNAWFTSASPTYKVTLYYTKVS